MIAAGSSNPFLAFSRPHTDRYLLQRQCEATVFLVDNKTTYKWVDTAERTARFFVCVVPLGAYLLNLPTLKFLCERMGLKCVVLRLDSLSQSQAIWLAKLLRTGCSASKLPRVALQLHADYGRRHGAVDQKPVDGNRFTSAPLFSETNRLHNAFMLCLLGIFTTQMIGFIDTTGLIKLGALAQAASKASMTCWFFGMQFWLANELTTPRKPNQTEGQKARDLVSPAIEALWAYTVVAGGGLGQLGAGGTAAANLTGAVTAVWGLGKLHVF